MDNQNSSKKPPHRKHWTLYVLLLEQGKYYVGITSQTPEQRFQGHLRGQKAYWTEKYRPVKIIQTVDLGELDKEAALIYEDRVTRRYMREKGVNNVRGGRFTAKNDLVARFGVLFPKDDWEAIVVILVLVIVVLYQAAVIAHK